MAHHWEIFKCRQQVFNCSRETFLLSRTRATGLKHSHHNLYCFIFVKSLTTGGPQMCHSSGSWSEIQSPHQNLIYDQPVGRGQGNQGYWGSWGKPCVDRAQPKPLHKHTWEEPPLPPGGIFARGNFCIWKQLKPTKSTQLWTLGSAAWEASGWNQRVAVLRTGSLQVTAHSPEQLGEEQGRDGERGVICPRSCCNQQQSQE